MSRRKNRYNNRVRKREEARTRFLSQFSFEDVASYNSLYNAAKQAALGVRWKVSVQRYLLNIMENTVNARKKLLNGEDVRKGFICFDVNERGKVRHIRSVHFSERVVQKSLCKNILLPVLTHNIIRDNSASQKGKGTKFATDELVKHLRKFYNKHGRNGYILLIDFKSYFDNIDHDCLKKQYRKYIKDEKLLTLTDSFVDAFGEKGLGLGSETSQIHAITYTNSIDHFIKDVCGIKYYGRYMDDSYIISDNKQKLIALIEKLKEKFGSLGIIISSKKTFITDLKHGFVFLKTRFSITESGQILRRPCRNLITKERRKLKKQIKLRDKGILTQNDIDISFTSWSGSLKRKSAHRTLIEMYKILTKEA